MIENPLFRPIRSFVRREGRLTPAQDRALSELLPRYQIPAGTGPINFTATFGNNNPVVLEIGFGNGTLLAEQASRHPEYNFLGVEVHRPGIGRLLQKIDAQASSNIRIMIEDAVEILSNRIPLDSLFAIWLFFPDPWPKKRHHKRRIMNARFLEQCAPALQADGILHMATDWQGYALHMQETIQAHPDFHLQDITELSNYSFKRPSTHFERRGQRRGHSITDLYARVEKGA